MICCLYTQETNSPQSHKLPLASRVSAYVARQIRNTIHPVMLLAFLKFIMGLVLNEIFGTGKNRGFGVTGCELSVKGYGLRVSLPVVFSFHANFIFYLFHQFSDLAAEDL